MKLKYACKIYDRNGNSVTKIYAGQEIHIKEVHKRAVNIEWIREDGSKGYGFISHTQFTLCTEEE